MLKLLTNKDSFIRKKIIDQNLSYLNTRLSHYLVKTGLPHEVMFKSDLEVEITQYGRDFDFDNLSRGERTRLILSLSWAFRDVYESINDKINLLFIDELIDYAERIGAPLELIYNLEELEENVEEGGYESIEDVWPDYPTDEDFFFMTDDDEEYT